MLRRPARAVSQFARLSFVAWLALAAAIRAVEPNADAINVRLMNPQSAVYYVLGEVNSPGSFPLIGRETVLDGILAAGGLSDRASPCNIILSRPALPDGCRIVIPLCYRQITQLGDTTTNFQIMPCDRIYVATRMRAESLLPRSLRCRQRSRDAGDFEPRPTKAS